MTRESVARSQPSEKPEAAKPHPIYQLRNALRDLSYAFGESHSLRGLLDSRQAKAKLDEQLRDALCNRANRAAAQTGVSQSVSPEGADLLDWIRKPPTASEPDDYLASVMSNLQGGCLDCQRAQGALCPQVATVIDAALPQDATGQPRSIELHTKLREAERVFQKLSSWLWMPKTVLGSALDRMDELRDWFHRMGDELDAVIATREYAAGPSSANVRSTPVADGASANARAIDMLRRNPAMARQASGEWANALGISASRVRNLPAWKTAKDRTSAPRRAQIDDVAKVAGEAPDVLEELIRVQKADDRAERRGEVYDRRI